MSATADDFSAAGAVLWEIEASAIVAIRRSENPNASQASSYSLSNEHPNRRESSALRLTLTPAATRSGSG